MNYNFKFDLVKKTWKYSLDSSFPTMMSFNKYFNHPVDAYTFFKSLIK